MKDPIEYFFPTRYYSQLPRTFTTNYLYDDLISSHNSQLSILEKEYTLKDKIIMTLNTLDVLLKSDILIHLMIF